MAWRGSTGRSWSGKALAAISLWSTSFVAIRVALESFSPAAIVTARLVLGALGLLAFLAWRDRKRVIPEPGERRGPILLGLVLAAHLFLQSLGLETTTAVHAGWIVGFATVPTALGAWLLLGERIRARGWLGIALATGGVLWILVAVTPGFERAHFGDTLQVVACFTWSAYALLGARLVVRSDPLAVTAVSMAVGALALAAAGALAGGLQTDVPLTARSTVALAILGLGGTALPFALWNQAVQEHGTVRTSSYHTQLLALVAVLVGEEAKAAGIQLLHQHDAAMWLAAGITGGQRHGIGLAHTRRNRLIEPLTKQGQWIGWQVGPAKSIVAVVDTQVRECVIRHRTIVTSQLANANACLPTCLRSRRGEDCNA